ncbi:MAG: GNAT family N-acetyltransferase, partial [Nocardioidaceae bacterium]
MTSARPADVSLRREATGEAAEVHHIVTEAFRKPTVGRLVDGLRVSDAWVDGLSFLAEVDGTVVGHVLFTRSLLDAPRRLVDVLVLSPLAVLPAYQGRGIGSALVRYGLDRIRDRPEPVVFLEGSPSYYPRFGFEPGGPLGFRRPSLRVPEAAFQVIRQPSYQPWMTGTLVYADAFWRHDCVGLRGE